MTMTNNPKSLASLSVDQALQQAIAHHKAGQLPEAERLYRAILQAQPNSPDANHNLGVLAVQVKQPAAGLPHFKAALEANPNQGQYWLSYLDALIQIDQIDAARQVLAQGRQRGLQGEAVDALAQRLEGLGTKHIQTAVEGTPTTFAATMQPGSKQSKTKLAGPRKTARKAALHRISSQQDKDFLVSLFNQGRYIEAAPLAQSMTERYPRDGFGWMILGAVFKQMGRSADALAALQKAVELLPMDAGVHYNRGAAFKDLGRLDEAEASYRRALKIQPHFAEAHNNLGTVLKELGRLAEAEASYRQASQVKPDYAEAHSNLGNVLKELDRLDEAEANFRRALQFKPGFAEVHYNLGSTLQELSRLDEAEACYRRATQLKPDYAEAYSNLGNVLKELDRLDEAEVSFRRALQVKPWLAKGHSNLGVTLKDMGRLEEAEASLRRALEIEPNLAEAHINLGRVLRDSGRPDGAEASYQQALEIEPDLAIAYLDFGAIFQEQGRLDEAEANYRRALEIKSDYLDSITTPSVTALLSFGRSGSLFFHSLFDGHPEIASLPGVYFKGWFGMDQWKRFSPNIANLDWRERLVAAILKEYQPLFDARCKKNVPGKPLSNSVWLARDIGFMDMGADRSQHFVVNQNAFATVFLSLLAPLSSIGQKDCFELIHRAFEIAIRGNTDFGVQENGRIFYHIHNPDPFELAHFLQHYPEARLLHILRNPVQSMESWMLAMKERESGILTSGKDADASNRMEIDFRMDGWNKMIGIVANMLMSMQSPFNRLAYCGGVRLEDVKQDANRVMPRIAGWMGISDHPALYEASFCGLQYWGPASKATGKITGFDTKAIDQPVGRLLGVRDVLIFETLFWPFSRQYGYTELDVAGFRRQLAEIRPWLDEPLEFEMMLYANLPDHSRALEALPPYSRLHSLLREFWTALERHGTYHGIVPPLELD